MRELVIVGALLAATAAAGGCKRSGGVGDECTATSDCKEPLVCDPVSDTCMNAGGTDASPGTDASGPGTDSAMGPGTDSAMGPGTDSAMGPGTDSAMGPGTDSAVGPGTDAAMASPLCTSWCACQTTVCATDDTNIYTGPGALGACLADCAGLAMSDVMCRDTHCGFAADYAMMMMPSEVDAHCDHSAGASLCM